MSNQQNDDDESVTDLEAPLDILSRPLAFPIVNGPLPLQHVPFWAVTGGFFDGPTVQTDQAGGVAVRTAHLIEMEQVWALWKISDGDLVGELALAPLEEIQFELRKVERRIIEQSREYATQFEQALESTSVDKESMSTVSTAAQSNQWSNSSQHGWNVNLQHSGTFGAQWGVFSAQAAHSIQYGEQGSEQSTAGGTASASLSKTLENVHEKTLKASKKLTTSTKQSFKATTDEISENRQRRTVTNPRNDAVMHVFGYEIVKHFVAATHVKAVRPAIVLSVERPTFDAKFVASHAEFLKNCLVDTALLSSLDDAVNAAASPTVAKRDVQAPAEADARLATLEAVLFRDDMGPDGNLPEFDWLGGLVKSSGSVYNPKAVAQSILNLDKDSAGTGGQGFNSSSWSWSDDGGSMTPLLVPLVVEWRFINFLRLQWLSYQKGTKVVPTGADPPYTTKNAAIAYGSARASLLRKLVADVKAAWDKLWDTDGARQSSNFDSSAQMVSGKVAFALLKDANGSPELTEFCRRIDTFVALAEVLLPSEPSADDPAPSDTYGAASLARLVAHLNANSTHYSAKHLQFLVNTLGGAWLVRFVNTAMSHIFSPGAPSPNTPAVVWDAETPYCGWFDAEGVRVRGSDIIVPLTPPAGGFGEADWSFAPAGAQQLIEAMDAIVASAQEASEASATTTEAVELMLTKIVAFAVDIGQSDPSFDLNSSSLERLYPKVAPSQPNKQYKTTTTQSSAGRTIVKREVRVADPPPVTLGVMTSIADGAHLAVSFEGCPGVTTWEG